MSSSGTSSVYFRPEVFDVIRYQPRRGELSVSAGGIARLHELYREKIGLHFFGDAKQFSKNKPFTLDPIRECGEECVACKDVDGMEEVTLTELTLYWGGAAHEIEIRKASDIFQTSRGKSLPQTPALLQAKFRVVFPDSKVPRVVTITSTKTSYTRDTDAKAIEMWMALRGFAPKDDAVNA